MLPPWLPKHTTLVLTDTRGQGMRPSTEMRDIHYSGGDLTACVGIRPKIHFQGCGLLPQTGFVQHSKSSKQAAKLKPCVLRGRQEKFSETQKPLLS